MKQQSYCDHLILAAAAAMLTLLASLTPAAAAACHPDDESGLLAFKSGITADPSGILSTWKQGTECCNWEGVECRVNNRVSVLWLSSQPEQPNGYLSGTISPSLAKLKFIDGLYFFNLRNLSGPLPSVLFNLPNLVYVYLENVGLSGPIPDTIGNLIQLDVLQLERNRFTGPIPASISKLTKLTQLRLGGNRLTGTIPVGIKNLRNLTYLSLEQNQLSGPIPDFFGSFTSLRNVVLSHNKLTGKIPSSISTLAPILKFLQLGRNSLRGTIPDFLGKFKSLDTLDLSGNKLTGTVPKSFSNLTKIFNLDLSSNSLVDPFPVMNVKGIESLDLSYNNFHLNTIPKWVTSSPIIYSLKLAKCGIKMRLDDWKPFETYFYDYIDLSENKITGSPVGLVNSTEFLVGFWAKGNKLRFDLERMRFSGKLRDLDLSRNLVYGKVPKVVSGLRSLDVSSNRLCGPIPATKFPASSFRRNACLCGAPLPKCKGA